MFMAAGLIYAALGHDQIADMAGVARAMPVTVWAFALAGIALMGVLPSGAYLAKKLLLDAAAGSGQWWWTIVLQGGAVFTAGYVVLVLVSVLRRPSGQLLEVRRVSRLSELAALALAVSSLLLALAAVGPLPAALLSNPLASKELLNTVLVVLGGALLAQGLARRPVPGPEQADAGTAVGSLRRVALAAGLGFERMDLVARRWSVASISLLTLVALFFGLLFRGSPT
jgi:NADH:ubiquinone oxidoreductase subunit 5 (subunit L)/multisubunit Na+/H+ antiporter MnhA subunit